MIDRFEGRNRFLSNFWPAVVTLDGDEYRSVEHAYQAAKSVDQEYRLRIRSEEKPGNVKRMGRRAPMRENWNDIKIDVMADLVKQKFFNNKELGDLLLNTGNEELVEGNTWGDTFWGISKGEGENHLGKILMDVRKELRSTSNA